MRSGKARFRACGGWPGKGKFIYVVTVYARASSGTLCASGPGGAGRLRAHGGEMPDSSYTLQCLPPLENAHPRRILELGCGTGAWALQAAIQFPDAEIVAVDLAEPPNRNSFPANVKFHMVDLTADLNLEPGSFDLVHARFVLVHVKNGKDLIARVAQLVKPGGLLLLEDADGQSMIETGGPALSLSQSKLLEYGRSRGTDREIGRKIGEIMAELPCLQDVHVRKVSAPFSGAGADDATNQLGRALATFMARAAVQIFRQGAVPGFSEAMATETAAELTSSDCVGKMDIYFCWASGSTAPRRSC
ncbi:S-adenosyl-L-methionine-dependent methyltransferase [Mycena rebaudengoi]|nr:S-adenosyl-L-methionine-dependent methyltransferase [Mycena rebaudengoi]